MKYTKEKLWESANKLRGNISANNYKDVVLNLLFLKYATEKFHVRHNELIEEGLGFEDDVAEYEEKGIFYLPEGTRYDELINFIEEDISLNSKLDKSIDLIAKKNKQLKNVLQPFYVRFGIQEVVLRDVMKIIDDIKPEEGKSTSDFIGEVYMYFLGTFARNEGNKGGEYFTPETVVETLVRLVRPFNGKLYDPACGSGGMFIHAIDELKKHEASTDRLIIYGQELNSETWRLAKLNMAIHGLNAKLGDTGQDTFRNDVHKTLKADYILANPPFNLDAWGQEELKDDARWKYGIPPKGNANYAWISHMLYHLSDKGTAGIVLANGSLSTNTKEEYEIRKNIIEKNKVAAIITLPPKLFMTTGIPVCIWILKQNKDKEEILFIDGKDIEGKMLTRALRVLTEEDIESITSTFHNYMNNKKYDEIKGFSKAVSLDEVRNNDYTLTPGRYVGIKEKEDDGIPFETKMEDLTNKLSKQFIKNEELEKKIKEELEKIGFEV